MKLYKDSDADLEILRGKKIAVLGFGSQGEAQAQNMADSKLDVIVGLKKGSASSEKAESLGFAVMETAQAAARADIVHILTPDETHLEVYENDIKPSLLPGKVISFSHGFSIVYGYISPPRDVDVVLVSPKMPGKSVREYFLNGSGAPGVFSVRQDASGSARNIALAIAKSIGLTRVGVEECTFEQETHINLFAEQSVLCGGLAELIKAGYETLVEKGYPPEMAYIEIAQQTKLLADLINAGGIAYMYSEVSNTAEYGGRTRGKKVIDENVRAKMKELLTDVQSGKFAKEWVAEYKGGLNNMKKLRAGQDFEKIEEVGKWVRENLYQNKRKG